LHSELIFDQTAVLGFPRYGFPAGATEQAIAGLERLVGHELPSSLKAMYRLHDGEVVRHGVDSPSLFFGLEFLSIAQSIEVRERFLAGLEADEEFPGLNEYHSLPPNTVQEVYYSRAWLPFAGLYTTDEIGLDFSPAAAGTVGQVILFRCALPGHSTTSFRSCLMPTPGGACTRRSAADWARYWTST
jgi:cell wall assembly regulator SMI1